MLDPEIKIIKKIDFNNDSLYDGTVAKIARKKG